MNQKVYKILGSDILMLLNGLRSTKLSEGANQEQKSTWMRFSGVNNRKLVVIGKELDKINEWMEDFKDELKSMMMWEKLNANLPIAEFKSKKEELYPELVKKIEYSKKERKEFTSAIHKAELILIDDDTKYETNDSFKDYFVSESDALSAVFCLTKSGIKTLAKK